MPLGFIILPTINALLPMPTLHKFITAFIVALAPLITAADAITDYATGKCGANLLTVVHDHCQPASIPSADDYATLLPQIYDVDDATLLPDFLAANAVVGSAPMRSDCAIPASWFNKSNPAASIVGADLHNIFPTTYANRNARADLPLMASTSANVGIGRTSDDKYTVYQPADRYKGAIARMVFYVAAIYMNRRPGRATEPSSSTTSLPIRFSANARCRNT
jgi:hypothetical protein